mgnify:CR=1 FL=1
MKTDEEWIDLFIEEFHLKEEGKYLKETFSNIVKLAREEGKCSGHPQRTILAAVAYISCLIVGHHIQQELIANFFNCTSVSIRSNYTRLLDKLELEHHKV